MLTFTGTSFRRVGHAFLLVIAIGLCLSGCDQIHPSEAPLRIQQDGSAVHLAVCKSVKVNRVLLETRDPGDPDWTKVWKAQGDLEIVSGQVLGSSAPPDGLAVEAWDGLEVETGSLIFVSLSGDEPIVKAQFSVPEGGLPSKEWMELDGTLFETPCD